MEHGKVTSNLSKTINRYRKVSVKMWGDDKFCSLTQPKPNGQTLWVYLITGPHTTALPCAFASGEASLSEALNWPISGFRKAFGEVFGKGMAQADWKSRIVFIPNALRHNPPESPNVVIGWRAAFNELPDCPLKKIIFAAVKVFLEDWAKTKEKGEAFVKAFGEDYAKDFVQSDSDTDSDTEQSKAESGNARETDPPENLEITSSMRGWADMHGFSAELIARETPAMLDHFKGKGIKRADWVATWRTWMRNSSRFGANNGANGNGHKNKQDRTAEAARRLLSRLDSQNGSGGERGIERSNPGDVPGASS